MQNTPQRKIFFATMMCNTNCSEISDTRDAKFIPLINKKEKNNRIIIKEIKENV